jgi:biopolymer transport protein ExbB
VDGWVIIGMCALMLVVSWIVMLVKAIVINKNIAENRKFEDAFQKLNASEIAQLNREMTEDDEDLDASPLLAMTGSHGQFAGSSLYRLYHVGVDEVNRRLAKAVGADVAEGTISDKAINAIRAAMESILVREVQKLNNQMVLLTIAISGGPFLGLLGTVLGVMITFGDIAASGEVNVNAIAPGIAAALATTVAGLVVAIPALFGYSYLASRIKLVTADMYIFVDEFSAKLSERYSD